ncbi:MAG: Lar family restriction alleviation protein [Kofleriaceae bacterium]
MHRGHLIAVVNSAWCYADGTPVATDPRRPCGHCGIANTPEGHDGCLGTLAGVDNACCGHGEASDAYVQFPGWRVDGSAALDLLIKETTMTTMIDGVLMPCPFCGENPRVFEAGHCIECQRCDVRLVAGDSLNEAITRWNQRATPGEQGHTDHETGRKPLRSPCCGTIITMPGPEQRLVCTCGRLRWRCSGDTGGKQSLEFEGDLSAIPSPLGEPKDPRIWIVSQPVRRTD